MRSIVIGVILCGCTQVPAECPSSPSASVRLTVVDGRGNAVSGVDATYSVDGEQPQPCDDWSGSAPYCGVDVSGELAVHVEADRFVPWDAVISVPEGTCHVESQDVEVVLTPVDACEGAEPTPAVAATIVGARGEYLTDVAVTWSGAEGGGPCDPPLEDGGEWTCGWQSSGAIQVTASAAGHVPQTTTLDVGSDACGPVTADVTISLAWE